MGSVIACAVAAAVYVVVDHNPPKCLRADEIGEVMGTETTLVKVKRADGTACVYTDYSEWRILKPGVKIKGPK